MAYDAFQDKTSTMEDTATILRSDPANNADLFEGIPFGSNAIMRLMAMMAGRTPMQVSLDWE